MADYHKMWEELGMDLETHDQLCEVLPQAFGDVYLSQENRPENMDYYDFVVAEIHGVRPAELIEHQKKGGKVFGTFCVYVPDEIVFAADAIATGLCGGSQFWVPGGEKVLPNNTCPLSYFFLLFPDSYTFPSSRIFRCPISPLLLSLFPYVYSRNGQALFCSM